MRRAAALACAAALVLTGCGDSADDEQTATTDGEQPAEGSGADTSGDATTDGGDDAGGTDASDGDAAATLPEGDWDVIVTLTGDAVPGGGDADARGEMGLAFDDAAKEVCYALVLTDIDGVTAMHIHSGGPGESGPVVVGLTPPTDTGVEGCVTVDDEVTYNDLRAGSGGYYVNVHSEAFPGGAVRADLGG